MRVVLFTKGLGLGGAERHVADLAIALASRSFVVSVIYLLAEKDALAEELRRNGVTVYAIGGLFWPLTALFKAVVRLYKLQPDVVHAHLPVPAIIARALKPLFGYRLMYTEHNVVQRLNPITRLFHTLTHRMDDVAISCSQAVADSLQWKSVTIENGIIIPDIAVGMQHSKHIRNRLSLAPGSIIFICIANLYRKKNHKLLISAFNRAFSGSDQGFADLVLVGQDGTERDELEKYSSQLETRGSIHFWGGQPNAAQLLPEVDVFCLSSDFEGLPIALLESMAAGLPSIVTRVGGMPAAVIDGETGLLVERGNEEGYANAMYLLAHNKALRESMGRRARLRVKQQYSQTKMVDDIVAVYVGSE